MTDNSTDGAGTIHSKGAATIANVSFENVILNGTSTDVKFTNDSGGGSASELEVEFDVGTGNSK